MCGSMANEHFFHPQTSKLFKKLEELCRRSNVSRSQAFEDWLTAMVCALAAETKEEEYLAMVARQTRGKPGQRGIDLLGQMFAELVLAMEKDDGDVLGDLFEGAITHGENGQYLTPETIASCMARLCVDANAGSTNDAPLSVNDPCCGTGRLLLEAAKINPRVELIGQDVDPRCVKITAINLGLRSRYGWVICGNSLSCDIQFAYRIGSFFHETPHGLRRGVIRDAPIETTPIAALAHDVRRDVREFLGGQEKAGESAASERSRIIEVPPWLSRLESSVAAQAVDAASRGQGAEPPTSPVAEVRKQQTLF